MKAFKKPIEIPGWLANLPGNAKLNSQEMLKIFKYKTTQSLSNAYNRNIIPYQSLKLEMLDGSGYRCFWNVSEIRNFIRSEKRKQQEQA